MAIEPEITRYHIQPYHMNGLNWRLVPDGAESGNIRVVSGFMPAWWEREYGITFGKDFHLDAGVHRQTLLKMNGILEERFGNLPGFMPGSDYSNTYACERRYGDAFIPSLFDATVHFDDASGHPFTELMNLGDKQVEQLTVPDLSENPVVRSVFDMQKGGFAATAGEIGSEGVINIAYVLRGQELFIDMIEKPDLFDHLCEVVWKTIDELVHLVRNWQSPGRPTHFVNCDCLINMISGEMYRDRLYRYEERFSESFDLFGIHTCNWTVDPYLDVLAVLSGRLKYLDMGADSDLDKVHRLFPDLKPAVFYHPEKLRQLTEGEICRDIAEMCRRIGRGFILVSDLEEGTEDSRIRAVYETAARY